MALYRAKQSGGNQVVSSIEHGPAPTHATAYLANSLERMGALSLIETVLNHQERRSS
ncbi:MAG: hypothetical protein NVS4B2_34600 [Chloroflexota bacterium]